MVLDLVNLYKITHQKDDTAGVYWWADAQFLPHDDTVLFVTSGAFEPRTNHAWVPITNVPHGRVVKIELDRQKLGGEIFSYTRMANLPKVHMHPSGSYIGYIAPESIKIETIKHEEVFNKHKDLRMCNYRFIAFAPNGKLMAVLLSCSRQFELMTCMVDKGFAFHDRAVDLSKMMKDFRLVRYNEHVECKWSADSEYIAVCSSNQFMFVLDKSLQLVVNIVTEILPDEVFPSWASTFDFNPCSCHELLAVGMNDRCVYFLNLESKEIVEQTEALSSDAIDCLQYHPFGRYVAVATRNFNIYLVDPCDGNILHHFDMHAESPNLRQRVFSVPNFIRFSFSTTGEQLATTTSDGKVRVYQMPVYMTLFDLCKWAIFTQVPSTKLNELPLPNQIVSKLLAFPVMK
ncbi:WD repeat and SOCS box-containing protein 1-like isoform X2 [Mercenaria mercenaria]|uniref:WD repeat and SOCS box-containing protein 1-like isoform X2 n=1 Tax=Mercenaria mercenaria TaxID=6596 RepID=UPI001E1DD10A|nr:WD repeat and SOCS box-containing protein 1-like isoform X2 [Mercenaria mercenaria]